LKDLYHLWIYRIWKN